MQLLLEVLAADLRVWSTEQRHLSFQPSAGTPTAVLKVLEDVFGFWMQREL
jgi:hypothetical protein